MAIKDEILKMTVSVAGDEARKQILDLTQAIEDSNSSLRQMKKEREMLAKQNRTSSERYKELNKAIKAESDSVAQNKEKISALRNQMSISNMTIAELSNRAKQLQTALKNAVPGSSDFKRLQADLSETKTRMDELKGGSANVATSLKGMTTSLTKALGAIGLAFAGAKKLFQTFSGGIKTIAEFEQANVNLATILGQDAGAIFELTNQATELGKTTQYTASQVTGLQTELAKLGFSQNQIQEMAAPVLNFATAVGSELPESAALAGATLRMFEMNAQSTDDALATLALSTNKSALNFSYLQTALSIVGPVANSFGFNLKDTTALLGTLANAGFDASSAATATRNILLNLANANGKLATSLGGPVKTFPEMIAGLKRLNEQGIDLAGTLELTDKRSVAAFNSFLSGADSALVLRDELENTDGVLQDIAAKRMNTVEGSIKALQSAWEGFVLSMKESQGIIKKTVDLLTDLVRDITPKTEQDPVKISARTSAYVRDLWNRHKGDTAAILKQIDEDEKRFGQKLKDAEAVYEHASGSRQRKAAEKNLKYWQEGVAVLAGARKELQDRVAWENGTYYDSTAPDGSGGSNNPNGPHGGDSKKNWSLQNDENFLAAKLALTVQYNNQEIKTKEDFENKVAGLEIATLSARIASGKETGAEKLKLEQELQDKILKLREKELKSTDDKLKKEVELAKEKIKLFEEEKFAESTSAKKKMDAENKRYEAEKKMFEGHTEALETIEKKHQRLMLSIQIEGKNDSYAKMQLLHEIERAEIENIWKTRISAERAGSGAVAKLQKQMAVELAQSDFEYLQELQRELKTITDSQIFEGVHLSEDQLLPFQKKLAEVEKQINEANATLNNDGYKLSKGAGGGSLFGVSQTQWEQLFTNIGDAKFQAEDLTTILAGIGGAAQEGFKIAQKAIEATAEKEKKELDDFKSAQETKKGEIKKMLDAGILSQQDYDQQLAALEEETAQREAEMKSKQAKRDKAMKLSQAIINTALSVTTTLAQFGATPWGIAASVIAAAMGAVEIGMIAAQPEGYAKGGLVKTKRQQDGRSFEARLSPDKRGWVQSPTILVGEEGPEYVIPADGVANPTMAPFLNTIESARRRGTLRSLNLGAVYPATTAIGRANGGYVSHPEATGATTTSGVSVSTQQLEILLGEVLKKMDKPVPAVVSMLGKGGFIEARDTYDRMRKAGRIGG